MRVPTVGSLGWLLWGDHLLSGSADTTARCARADVASTAIAAFAPAAPRHPADRYRACGRCFAHAS
jgi:hypothetical protein